MTEEKNTEAQIEGAQAQTQDVDAQAELPHDDVFAATTDQAPAAEQPPSELSGAEFQGTQGEPVEADQDAQVTSSVSMATKSKKMMIGAFSVVFGILFYFMVLDSGDASPEQQKRVETKLRLEESKDELLEQAVSIAPQIEEEIEVVKEPELPAPPPVKAPLPPPPPPTPPPPPPPPPPSVAPIIKAPSPPSFLAPPSFGVVEKKTESLANAFGVKSERQKDEDLEKKQYKARRGSGIMVFGGGGGGNSEFGGKAGEDGGKASGDKKGRAPKEKSSNFLGFSEGALEEDEIEESSTKKIKAKVIGRMDNLIAQGKVIYAILETAINTDLEGMVRGIVTRDVYAERNKNVLIQKGSRIIGQYSANITNGQTRVDIVWDRLIRPDGIDIDIGSKASDALGRAGIKGKLDNKFWSRATSAFLVSYLLPKAAKELKQGATNDDVATTVTKNTDGSTVTNTSGQSSKNKELKDSLDKFTKITEDALSQSFSEKPTVHIQQGARINILVQHDLVFPTDEELRALKKRYQ